MMSVNNEGTRRFTSAEISLSASNYTAQTQLVTDLRAAFAMRDMSVEALATELDLTAEDAQAWLDGEVDLSLTELRYLANAIDARVSYHVVPMTTRHLDRIARLDPGDDWHAGEAWNSYHYDPSRLARR